MRKAGSTPAAIIGDSAGHQKKERKRKMTGKQKDRVELVKAMDTIVRSFNNENIFEPWLWLGVADGDITENTTDDDLSWYIEKDNFIDIVQLFMKLCVRAFDNGGIYCGGICIEKEEEEG